MFEFVTARELFELVQVGSEIEKDQLEYVELDGWVRTNRNNGSVGFIELNDGTYFKNVQLVYNKGDESSSWNYDVIVKQYTLDLGDITVVNEELVPRIHQLMENPEKAEKFVSTLIEQIKSDDDPRETRGYNMARALLENSLDGFLIALCGWGTKSLLNIAEFGSAHPEEEKNNG